MINELEDILAGFPGPRARSRCFCHIINLVAKALLRQFEPPKPKKKKGKDATHRDEDEDDPSLDDWDKELRSLMEDLDFDDEQRDGQIEDEVPWDANDEIDEASRADIQAKARPVKMMLLKVSNNCPSSLSSGSTHRIARTAPENLSHHPPLANPPLASLGEGRRDRQAQVEEAAARRTYPLEFDVPDAGCCTRIPHGHRADDRRAGEQPASLGVG